MTKLKSREEVMKLVASKWHNTFWHCCDCWKMFRTMEEIFVPPGGGGTFCEKCYKIERAEEIAKLKAKIKQLQAELKRRS